MGTLRPPQYELQLEIGTTDPLTAAEGIQAAVPAAESSFQFIDVRQESSLNRKVARSHVMKGIRKERKKAKDASNTSRLPIVWQNKTTDLVQLMNYRKGTKAVYTPTHDLYCEAFAATMIKNASSGISSWVARLEADISTLPVFTKRFTPMVSQMIQHYTSVIWPLYYPGNKANDLPPMAIAWWKMVRESPMVFHACTHYAAVSMDSFRSSTELTSTVEALAHKTEAIRLINHALSELQRTGEPPDDALLMAVLAMTSTTYANGTDVSDNRPQCPSKRCPFKPGLMPIHAQKQFAKMKDDPTHEEALFMLLQLKGGIEKLSPMVCKAIEHHALLSAAVDLKHPRVPWQEAHEIIALEEDSSINVPILAPAQDRGIALLNLAGYGINEGLVAVLLDLQQITLLFEAYSEGTLQNPSIASLASRRNRAVHALLCLPTRNEVASLSNDNSALYESCRLAAMVYVLAIVFPLPPFTGVIARLVPQIVLVVDGISSEILYGPAANPFIWSMFVCGAAAETFPQRPWFVKKLQAMLAFSGVDRWVELKAILRNYLWLDSAMDEPGFNLFDEIQHLQQE